MAWLEGYCPIPGQLIPLQWAEFRYCIQISPVCRCLLETTKISKKSCEAKVIQHSELGCSGSLMTFKRSAIKALASQQHRDCRTDQGLFYWYRGVLEYKSSSC